MFLPATAVDLSGNRIGQGGGYYDKFLAAAERRAACSLRGPPSSTTPNSCPLRPFLLRASTVPSTQCSRPPGWSPGVMHAAAG